MQMSIQCVVGVIYNHVTFSVPPALALRLSLCVMWCVCRRYLVCMERFFLLTVPPRVLPGAAVEGGGCEGEECEGREDCACFLAASRRVICRRIEKDVRCGSRGGSYTVPYVSQHNTPPRTRPTLCTCACSMIMLCFPNPENLMGLFFLLY